MQARAHIVVIGLVQGVGYRWFAADRARRLGLSGSVRNLRDGSVEVEAQGERGLVEELIRDLRIGPRSSRVADLRIEWQAPASGSASPTFDIR